MELLLPGILQTLVAKFPWLVPLAFYVGFSRLFMKPLVVFVSSIVEITPSQKDNEFLAMVLESKVYKILSAVLDYAASIKLPQANK